MSKYFRCNRKCTCSRIIKASRNEDVRVCIALHTKPKDINKCKFFDADSTGLKAKRIDKEIKNYTYCFYHK